MHTLPDGKRLEVGRPKSHISPEGAPAPVDLLPRVYRCAFGAYISCDSRVVAAGDQYEGERERYRTVQHVCSPLPIRCCCDSTCGHYMKLKAIDWLASRSIGEGASRSACSTVHVHAWLILMLLSSRSTGPAAACVHPWQLPLRLVLGGAQAAALRVSVSVCEGGVLKDTDSLYCASHET